MRSLHFRSLVTLGLPVALAHCVPPPALTLPFEGTVRDPVGTLSAGGYGSYTGDYTSRPDRPETVGPPGSSSEPMRNPPVPSAVGNMRVGYQFARNVAVAVDVGGGSTFAHSGNPLGVVFGRAHVRLHPESDHFAFVFGAGGGSAIAQRPMGLLTLDAGARAGFRTRYLDGYVAESLSLTVVTDTSAWPVFFWGTDIGLIAHPEPRLGLGAHLSMLLPFTTGGAFDRPAFIPSVSVRYAFDMGGL